MKETIILPNNILPRGIAKGDVGMMNRDGVPTAVDFNGNETALGASPEAIVDAISESTLTPEALIIPTFPAEHVPATNETGVRGNQIVAGGVTGGVFYDPTITGLTGGGATKLDGITTVGVAVGRVQLALIEGQLYAHDLRSGTTAESDPSIIRPDDYHASTNAKYWALASLRSQSSAAATLTVDASIVLGDAAVGFAFILPDNLTDERTHQLPDADGTLASVPTYADLTAANVVLDAGDFFWDTTLKKLRVATA